MPTLETARLVLRPVTLEDAPQVVALMQDGHIAATTLYIPHPYALEDATGWIETHPARAQAGAGYSFALTLRASGELVGGFGLHANLAHARAEIGYWLGTPHWGRGLMTEGARAVLDWAFAHLPLERVQAGVFVGNAASVRVQEKLGMRLEGTLRGYYRKDGAQLDSELRAVLRAEWRG